jgi:hypothetical protein
MTLAELATPACPPTRDIHCSRNPSAAPYSRVPGQLASSTCANSRNIPSAPRQSSTIISLRDSSKSHIRAPPAAVVARSVRTLPLPRDKSGKPLKPSLKVSRTHSQGSLSVITDPGNASSSKSAPATPAHKGVRFHSQLEHVKLFVAKQKPLSVSRDGSPIDTSGTDSEFSSIIHHGRDNNPKERLLVMHHIDVPTAPPLPEDTRDVAVESIDLVGTMAEGTVRVRNIAFKKWIAVRFTLDKWQTTSEVTGRYKESLQDGTFDRFTFSIKLADVLSRAEEKTLYLAVRYSVSGREIWDNNSGRNYQVKFVRGKALNGNTEARSAVVEIREESSRADNIADLQRKLEELVKIGCPSKTISGILAQESRRRCESPPPALRLNPPLPEETPRFKSEGIPPGRYDFAASSRTPRRPPAEHQTLSPAQILFPPTTAAAEVSSPIPGCDSDDHPMTLVSSPHSGRRRCGGSCSGSCCRNHSRGGTIVLSGAPGVKCTPPTSPFADPALSAVPLLPLSALTLVLSQPQPHAYFDSSMSSSTSSSWSPSPTTSSSSSPVESASPTWLMPPVPDTNKESDSPIHHFDYHKFDYHKFVNRYGIPIFHCQLTYLDADSFSHSYCFYTGSESGEVLGPSDFTPRSSVETLPSTPYSSNSPFATPSLTEMGTWDCFGR